MKKLFLILSSFVALSALTVSARAQSDARLTTGLSFLKSAGSGELAGLGDQHVAGVLTAAATRFNPAIGAFLTATNTSFDYQTLAVGGNTNLFSATTTSASGFALGLTAYMTRSSAIEVRTGPTIDPLYISTPQNFAVAASAAMKFDSLAIGLDVKWVNQRITAYNADGIGFDLGALYHFSDEFQAGAALQDVGGMGKLGNEASEFPARLTLTLATKPQFLRSSSLRSTLLTTYQAGLEDGFSHFSVGIAENYAEHFELRVGYLTGEQIRGISFGAGIRYSAFSFDYSFAPGLNGFSAGNVFGLAIKL
jgi:hypothetical protein